MNREIGANPGRFRGSIEGLLAQLVEQRTLNPLVGSSNLPGPTKLNVEDERPSGDARPFFVGVRGRQGAWRRPPAISLVQTGPSPQAQSKAKTMKNTPQAGQQLAFQATLENWAEGMDYCAVPVPPEITQALGTKGPVLVMARLHDSAPFQVSLFPVGGGKHYIRIKAKVRQATKTKAGDQVRVQVTVLDRADVTIPDDLASALQAVGAAQAFKCLPPGKQNFMIRRIDEAAKSQTRQRRIQEAVEAAHERREKGV